MNSFKSISTNTLIPLFISLIFGVMLYNEAKIPSIFFKLTPYIFYTLSLIIIWVSWHFNRNRFIFILLPLLFMQFGFEYLSPKKASLLFTYVSILFPLHLLIFLVLKERGLFSIWGILKIAFFIFEIALISYLIYSPQSIINEYINIKLFAMDTYPLKDISIAISIFCSFVILGLILFGNYIIYSGSFLIMLITFELGLYFLKTPYATGLSFLSSCHSFGFVDQRIVQAGILR